MEVPMKYSSFDAYCRQSNALDEEIAKRIDEYQAGHANWMTEGTPRLPSRASRRSERGGVQAAPINRRSPYATYPL
jgi:hypothetical protein